MSFLEQHNRKMVRFVLLACLPLKPEVESKTQGSRPRPKTQKKSEAKDSLSEDRHSRGQGQECSRPKARTKDTRAQVLSKKKVFTKIFQAISTKKRFPKNFSSASQNFNSSKNSAVLEPRTGQFSRTWDLEAKECKMCPRGRPRGQGRPRGLHLCLKPFTITNRINLERLLNHKPFNCFRVTLRQTKLIKVNLKGFNCISSTLWQTKSLSTSKL